MREYKTLSDYERFTLRHAVQMAVKMVDDELEMAMNEISIAGFVWTEEHKRYVEEYRKEYLMSLEVDNGRQADL